MQRRQNATVRSARQQNGSLSPPELPHNHGTSSRHTGSTKPFRVHKHRSKKLNFTKLCTQCLIVVVFVCSVIACYNSAVAVHEDSASDNDFEKNSGSAFGKKILPRFQDQTGDEAQQNVLKHFEQPDLHPLNSNNAKTGVEAEAPDNITAKNSRRKRTTEEANAYMASQSSHAVDGEQALKKKLVQLYEKQKESDQEDSSPVVTRWLDRDDVQYWVPKSSTSHTDTNKWKEEVKDLKEEAKRKDKLDYPHLYQEIHGGDSKEDKDKMNGKNDNEEAEPSSASSREIVYRSPAKDGTSPIISPSFGEHRSNVDAVFALAEGYDLKIYLLFIESLKKTGFTGDLVLSVSAKKDLKPGVEDYLKSQQAKQGEDGINVVGYTVTWTCYEGDGVTVAKGAKEGVRKCALVDMYGETIDGTPVKDPREPRPVATARYELYWAWSLHYDKHSWLMLIDSRDAYFQLNPFANVKRETDMQKRNGLLYLFEVSFFSCPCHKLFFVFTITRTQNRYNPLLARKMLRQTSVNPNLIVNG